MTETLALFPELDPGPIEREPAGLRYADGVVTVQQQRDLMARAGALDFARFDFRGFKGNRRTVSFGSRYDFTHNRIERAGPLPDWLEALQAAAAAFADIPQTDLVQALVTEYAPGAGIGWHKDRPEYGKVVGLSFASDCVLRFRRPEPGGFKRAFVMLRPGSAYLLHGSARDSWQHSIAPGHALRYSITFRTLRSI